MLASLESVPCQNGTFQQGLSKPSGFLWERRGGLSVRRKLDLLPAPLHVDPSQAACYVLGPLLLCHCCHSVAMDAVPESCGSRYHLTSVHFFSSIKRGKKPQVSSVGLLGFHPWRSLCRTVTCKVGDNSGSRPATAEPETQGGAGEDPAFGSYLR